MANKSELVKKNMSPDELRKKAWDSPEGRKFKEIPRPIKYPTKQQPVNTNPFQNVPP